LGGLRRQGRGVGRLKIWERSRQPQNAGENPPPPLARDYPWRGAAGLCARDDDMLTPTAPPPNTAAGTAHSAHSTTRACAGAAESLHTYRLPLHALELRRQVGEVDALVRLGRVNTRYFFLN